MKIEITGWRPFAKNTLQGFLTMLLPDAGLEIRDATLHEKNGKQWIGLPSKPYKAKDGSEKWSYIVGFPIKEDHWNFQRAALAALDHYRAEEKDSDTMPF